MKGPKQQVKLGWATPAGRGMGVAGTLGTAPNPLPPLAGAGLDLPWLLGPSIINTLPQEPQQARAGNARALNEKGH